MTFYRVFNGKVYIIFEGFDYPCRPVMFVINQVLRPNKGLTQYNLIFPETIFGSGYQVTHHECQDSGETCKGRGTDGIFNKEFIT